MSTRIGIRREDKSIWERRVPLVPNDARELQKAHDIEVWVQPSDVRAFREEEYKEAGVRVVEDLSPCPVTFAVKEIPPDFFRPDHAYVFFAHVIKGQEYNMPMLQRLLELGCHLIDYEKVTDERGRRLIFFGRHAGLAGMVDTLWALGQRLNWEGIDNPFSDLRQAHEYEDLAAIQAAVSDIGARIARERLPGAITPFICGFAGYGNVFRGANEIIELLPIQEIAPSEVAAVAQQAQPARDRIYKVVFKEEHTVEPISPDGAFELQDYYEHPEKYRGRFNDYLPHLNVLVNCVYWEEKYPRLVTKSDLKQLYRGEQPRLRVIGDISCDIEGAIEATVKSTEPGDPVFVYDPFEDRAIEGVLGNGPVIMAVDILPSEIPRDSSVYFSEVLKAYIPIIAKADYSVPFEELDLPPEIKRAVIVYQGELTPEYCYLKQHLE
ncbi:MAG TPA: hypothetical protein ENN19_05450 [Chloroflexi bacterium]|nr:hypothetical protein [Chloroflexota bacterium]